MIQLWPRLLLVNGILCQKYEDLESKQEWTQLVVPQSLREEVMEELHAGIMGGHVRLYSSFNADSTGQATRLM